MTLNPITDEPQFRECPACGNPIPVLSTACPHCGAQRLGPDPMPPEAAGEYRFLHALFTRSNPYTMIIVGINVGVFVLMCLAGGLSATSVDPQVLRGFGAKDNSLIAEHHEYWRLITSIFIHIGFIHLLLNNYALWIIGREIEQIYGSARFVSLYLITGIIGSLASYVFNPGAVSAGASGSIFGLFGVMAAFAFRYRKEIPQALTRDIRRRVLPVIALNLVFGFSVRIVDNAAHVGGLLAGVALALVVPYMRPNERRTPMPWRALQILSLIAMFVSFVSAFRGYDGPALSLSNLTNGRGAGDVVVNYVDHMRDGRNLLIESFKSVSSAINRSNKTADVAPALDMVERGMRAVNAAPVPEARAGQFRTRLLELLAQQKSLLDEFARSKDRDSLLREENALFAREEQFVTEYENWLPGFLKERGYELRGGDNH